MPILWSTASYRAVDGAAPDPCDRFLSTSHEGRRPDVVRAGNLGHLPTLRYDRRSHLEGYQPGRLPVQAPAKFEFAVNLKTATTLGLTVPPTVIALADEVIE